MKVVTDGIILRNIDVSKKSLKSIVMLREPKVVARLVNERRFIQLGSGLVHRDSIQIQDRLHDWNWMNGKFSYSDTGSSGAQDIVIAYEVEEVEGRFNFCPQTGTRILSTDNRKSSLIPLASVWIWSIYDSSTRLTFAYPDAGQLNSAIHHRVGRVVAPNGEAALADWYRKDLDHLEDEDKEKENGTHSSPSLTSRG